MCSAEAAVIVGPSAAIFVAVTSETFLAGLLSDLLALLFDLVAHILPLFQRATND